MSVYTVYINYENTHLIYRLFSYEIIDKSESIRWLINYLLTVMFRVYFIQRT